MRGAHQTVAYADGEKTKVLKLRRVGKARTAAGLYISADVMQRMGWTIGDQVEILEKDGVLCLWKRDSNG